IHADALLRRLGYVGADTSLAPSVHDQRHRAAVLRAASSVTGLFAAESPDAPGAHFFCGLAGRGRLDLGGASSPPAAVAGCDMDPGRAFERCVGEAVEYLSQLGPPPATADAGVPLAAGTTGDAAEELVPAASLADGTAVA